MKKLLLTFVFTPAIAWAQCVPSNAPAGSIGCLPHNTTAQSTDILYAWRTALFPTPDMTLTVQSIINTAGSTQYMPFSGGTFTGAVTFSNPIAINSGGTGATSLAAAQSNLGIVATGTSGPTVPTNNGGFTQSGAVNFTGTFQVLGAAETFPGSGLLAGTTDTQTLTNKTLTSPIISGAVAPTGAWTFINSDLLLLGSSTGYTTFASANASATNYTVTFPAATDTVVELALAQTLTNKTLTTPTINGAAISGTLTGTP